MASIFDFLTGGSPKPAWSYLGHEGATAAAPGGGATSFGAMAQPAGSAAPATTTGYGANALKWGKVAGRGWLAGAPVLGAAGAALDPQENVKNLADSVGVDYNSFGGRVGSNALNFLLKTGDAATFGGASALGRGLANVIAGQSFFDPYKSAGPGAAPAASPVASQTGWNSGQDLPLGGNGATGPSSSGAVPPVSAAGPNAVASFPQPGIVNPGFGAQGGSSAAEFKAKWGDPTRGANETPSAYVARRTNAVFAGNSAKEYDTTGGSQPLPLDEMGLPPSGPFAQAAARRVMYGPGNSAPIASGTGVFRGSSGGYGALDSRVPGNAVAGSQDVYGPAPAQAPEVFSPTPDGSTRRADQVQAFARTIGGGAGSALEIARGVGAQKTRTAQDKMQLEYAGKREVAAHATAQTNEINARVADAERVRAAGGSQEEINAARSGRPMTGGRVIVTPTMKEGQVITTEPRTGESVMRTALPQLTESLIASKMNVKNPATKKNYTREEVIQDYRNQGGVYGRGYGARPGAQ